MGSELVLLAVDWKARRAERATNGFYRVCDDICNKIKGIKCIPRDVEDINSDWEIDGGEILDEEGEVVSLEQYKEYLLCLAKELRDSANSRDATIMKFGDRYVFITGGQTWGDSPGDTFDVLSKLYAAGVVS